MIESLYIYIERLHHYNKNIRINKKDSIMEMEINKIPKPSEINAMLEESVRNTITAKEAFSLTNFRTREKFYGVAASVINNLTGWNKEGGVKKIAKTALTIMGVTWIGFSNAALIAGGLAAYTVWKGHKEKKAFKKFAIKESDLTKEERSFYNKMGLKDFAENANLDITKFSARKFFEKRGASAENLEIIKNAGNTEGKTVVAENSSNLGQVLTDLNIKNINPNNSNVGSILSDLQIKDAALASLAQTFIPSEFKDNVPNNNKMDKVLSDLKITDSSEQYSIHAKMKSLENTISSQVEQGVVSEKELGQPEDKTIDNVSKGTIKLSRF